MPAPKCIVLPSITIFNATPFGEFKIGTELVGHKGEWEGKVKEYFYQWAIVEQEQENEEGEITRIGAQIEGATEPTLIITKEITEKYAPFPVYLIIGAVGEEEGEPLEGSLPTGKVGLQYLGGKITGGSHLPICVKGPRIEGVPSVGQTLTGVHGEWYEGFTDVPCAITGYMNWWQRLNTKGEYVESIEGAYGTHYKLTKADLGYIIRMKEQAQNSFGWSPVGAAYNAYSGVVLPEGQIPIGTEEASFMSTKMNNPEGGVAPLFNSVSAGNSSGVPGLENAK